MNKNTLILHFVQRIYTFVISMATSVDLMFGEADALEFCFDNRFIPLSGFCHFVLQRRLRWWSLCQICEIFWKAM